MTKTRPTFSVCIPAYNRARHLAPLLNSVFAQEYRDFEVVICEDNSRERELIAEIVRDFAKRFPSRISYHENSENLGYDANIRNLISKAAGRFCFFMGNDDLMCPGALGHVAEVLGRYRDVAMVLKSYAWFDGVPDKINQEVRYFREECSFPAGRRAILVCYRRSGVISGYIVDRDLAHSAATERFDGTLFYQMHLTANVLADKCAVFTPRVLVLCRDGEPPEFGNSESERGKYVPGMYTSQARVNMLRGVLQILNNLKETRGIDVIDDVMRDYANYFFPYIRDQLTLPARELFNLYRCFGKMGFDRYPLFHVYFVLGYLLGVRKFDALTRFIRHRLGRSPRFGNVSA